MADGKDNTSRELTPAEIVRACIATAESESPGNEWWSISIARKHLEALLAENEEPPATARHDSYVRGARRQLVTDIRAAADHVLAATDYAQAYMAFNDLARAVTALDEQIAAKGKRSQA